MKLLLGDCLEQMKTLKANSVDSIVTDPPYGLSFMGKKWDYDVPSVEIWREALRVLKPGGHLLAFGGTRTYHRLAVNIEDAGFEIRDQIQWIYGSGFPKSLDVSKAIDKAAGAKREVIGKNPNNRDRSKHNYNSVGDVGSNAVLTMPATATATAKAWQGFGTALKPANEPIVLARKPLAKGKTVAGNVLEFGTGALNIDASRIGTEQTETRRGVSQTGPGGWKTTGFETPQKKLNPPGRFPANVLFDEHAAAELDRQSGTLKSGELKGYKIPGASANGHLAGKASREIQTSTASVGGASRFFYVAKSSKSERNRGLEGMPKKKLARSCSAQAGNEHKGSGFNSIQQVQNHHPTVKPVKLMEYLVRMVTPPGGVCFDPFMGSGSTGVACVRLGFDFIGCEMNPEYLEIAKRRIEFETQEAEAS